MFYGFSERVSGVSHDLLMGDDFTLVLDLGYFSLQAYQDVNTHIMMC